ncbi:unnamed protein product [Somion occarium]|uniref:Prolyl 4-hydroxylase alpha subunit Fe(2+) 2OG dioxygenase domain-containing protein n=1 Tax=Somion occarium TaxID=3059160 RepID=A0ABP1DRY1_9APHY
MSDFEVETPTKMHATPPKMRRRRVSSDYDSEVAYRNRVARLIAAKARPITASGRIPVDPASLTLFFRSKSGITHSLDFPVDIDEDMPPALDVLISSCRPHSPSGLEDFSEHESLFYPSNLPLTATLEIANHPILDAVRNTLFPTLPIGHYLTAMRDKLEIWLAGGGMKPLPHPNDSRVATIFVTLPVRFRGGALVVRSMDGTEERFHGRGGKAGDMEWTAFMADCDHEIQPVLKGCRVTISYAVHLRTFGTAQINPDPLISPSDQFLDMVSPILNMSRGRRIAFYLSADYGVNPAEVLAESLVPHLKGGDSVLYHALKLYKLAPELRWSAGGYLWGVDQVVDLMSDLDDGTASGTPRAPFAIVNGSSPLRRTMSNASDDTAVEDMRTKVEKSGAVTLAEAEVIVLSDTTLAGAITKERVPFVQGNELEKLVINILMVVYVP